jgi:hypothetical protein
MGGGGGRSETTKPWEHGTRHTTQHNTTPTKLGVVQSGQRGGGPNQAHVAATSAAAATTATTTATAS